MKRMFLTLAAVVAGVLGAAAQGTGQDSLLTGGVYEKKVVVAAEGVKAGTLYTRALEALSDWAGAQEKSELGIDVQDKDEGLIVFKGDLFLGVGKMNFMYGWRTFADLTLKVRSKDGRAQITVTVPSLTFIFEGDETKTTAPLRELLPEYTHKSKYKIKTAAKEMAPKVPEACEAIVALLTDKMKNGVDDDF